MELSEPDFLIIGGDTDPNLTRLISHCAEAGLNFQTFLHGRSGTPATRFDLKSNIMELNGRCIKPGAAFIRPDVFQYLDNDKNANLQSRANEWFTLMIGWLMGNPEIKLLNRAYFNRPKINKINTLLLAERIGLPIPETHFTNSAEFIHNSATSGNWVRKPVDGGSMTRPAAALPETILKKGQIAAPTTLQEQLIQPEIRLYRIGNSLNAFEVESKAIDYREAKDTTVRQVEVPENLADRFTALTDSLHLDFAAADFKSSPETGELMLLEVNSGPMFVAHDIAAKGALCTAITKTLANL